MMGSGEQKLTIETQLKGAKQTAEGLGKIDEAQKKVTEAGAQSTNTTKQATEATNKLNTSESELIGLLSAISPALGGFADSVLRGARVAGDLAGKNINVTQSLKGMSSAITKNTGAFKLMFAGGALLAGLAAIALSVRRITEEWDRATKAIRDNAQAMNELKGIEADRQQTIENVADSRSRIGGIDSQASRDALQLANKIKSNFGGLDQSGIDNTVGALTGTGLTKEQIEQAAILQQQGRLSIDKDAPAERLVRVVERAIERNSDAIKTFITRESAQGQGVGIKGERAGDVAKEVSAKGGSTLNLQAVLKQFALAGQNIERLAEIAQTFGSTEAIDKFNKTLRSIFAVPGRGDNLSDIWDVLTFRSPTVEAAGTEAERAVIRNALQAIENNRQPNVIYNQQGGTFVGSDAAARAQREADGGIGENARTRAEN